MSAGVPLHCPRCRRPDGRGGVEVHTLEQRGGGLACPGCGAAYPVVDGIPVVARDVAPLVGAAEEAGWPPPADEWCARLAEADPSGDEAREAWLLAMYAVAHHPPPELPSFVAEALADQDRLGHLLGEWLERHGPLDGAALEVGAGPGGWAERWLHAVSGAVILFDLRLGMLRAARELLRGGWLEVPWRRVGRRYTPLAVRRPPVQDERLALVAGDALDPPFPAGAFSLVAALNVVDAVRDPWTLLGQLDALLAPGSLLLLAQPYHLEPHAQPPEAWIEGPEALRRALGGGLHGLEHLRFRVLEEAFDVPWSLPAHDRLAHRYGLHVLLVAREGEV
ncbi:MAG: methyltransferase domain-containing protein [Myxococcota bacterium]